MIPGGKNGEEVAQCAEAMGEAVPPGLWVALKAAGLIPEGMPVPVGAPVHATAGARL